MKAKIDLGSERILPVVCSLAIPTMLAQFVNVLYSIVDRMYIGNIEGIGSLALAGVGICGPVLTLISSFASLVGLGGSPLIAMFLGRGQRDRAEDVVSNGFAVLIALAAFLTAACLLAKDSLLMLFGASEATFEYADTYFTIYVSGTVFSLLATGLNSYLIAQGYSGRAMFTVVLGAVMNIALDPVFIFLFKLDTAGAAIATVISQMCSCAAAYHLHVVYIPVVEKQVLWSKRCKDKSLVGTVKETLMQVSRSKKWASKPALDAEENPMLNAKGKQILKSSYSVLQDDFFHFMHSAGYLDVERGERGSTEEHLTVTQFKVRAEQRRLEAVSEQVAQAEQTLENVNDAAEKQEQRLHALKKETKTAKVAALTAREIKAMGKKNPITGNVSLTPQESATLKKYAVGGLALKAENAKLREQLTAAEKAASIWKQRYDALHNKYTELKKKAQPYLDALEATGEKVRAFVHGVLARARGEQERKQPHRELRRDTEL